MALWLLPQDPTVQVAIVGAVATLITTLGAVAAVVLNNRKERGDAADAGVEATLKERLNLKDEIIEVRDETIETLRAEKAALQEENQEKTLLIRELRAELRKRKP